MINMMDGYSTPYQKVMLTLEAIKAVRIQAKEAKDLGDKLLELELMQNLLSLEVSLVGDVEALILELQVDQENRIARLAS